MSRGGADWIEVKLKDVFNLKQGTYLEPEEIRAGLYKVYGANGVIGLTNKIMYEDRTVLVSCRGANCGVVHFTMPRSWVSNNSIALVPKTATEVVPDFTYYQLLNSSFKDEITGSAQPQIVVNVLENKCIKLPCLKEQKKIAEILTSVDRVIELTSLEIDKLKDLKKGMMQELLTKGIGHTKFKDSPVGKIPESWEYDLIDNVAIRRSGHTPDKEVHEYWNGAIQWISLADSSKLDNLYISESDKYITQKGIENSSAVLMPAGVVVMTRDAGIGKSAISLKETAVSQHFMAWECNKSKLDNYFLYYQLQYLKPVFEAEATGTTIKTIGLPFFKKFKICIPPIKEQVDIRDSLLSIDKNIFIKLEKLNSLLLTKKGLMNDLLTGKVRVKV